MVNARRKEVNADGFPTFTIPCNYTRRPLKVRARSCCLAILLTILLSPLPVAFADHRAGSTSDGAMRLAVSRAEVPHLLKDLESSDRARRDRAFDRLVQVEPPVRVTELDHLWQHDKVEIRRTALRLVAALQERYGVSAIRVNGLEFFPCVDLVWRKLPPGVDWPVRLDLKVTNVGDKTVRYIEAGAPGFRLWDADGELVKHSSGADGSCVNVNIYSPPLKTGKSRTTSGLLKANLYRSIDGKRFELRVEDRSGAMHSFGDLKSGRYYLSFQCSCPGQAAMERAAKQEFWVWGKPPKDGISLWRGDADTPIIAVEVK